MATWIFTWPLGPGCRAVAMESKEKERNKEGKKERTFLFPLKLGHRRKKTFLYLSFFIPLSSIYFSILCFFFRNFDCCLFQIWFLNAFNVLSRCPDAASVFVCCLMLCKGGGGWSSIASVVCDLLCRPIPPTAGRRAETKNVFENFRTNANTTMCQKRVLFA